MNSIEYQPFSEFYQTLLPLVAPEDLGAEMQPFFRDQIGNALSDLQTLIPWLRGFNVEFLEKGGVDEFCNASVFQGPVGKISQLFAYRHGVDCQKFYYRRATTSQVDCWMERQRYLCPPIAQACLEADFSVLGTSGLVSWWEMRDYFGDTMGWDQTAVQNHLLNVSQVAPVTYADAADRGGLLGAAVFGGSIASLRVTDIGLYTPTSTGTLTIGLWVKLDTLADGQILTYHNGTTVKYGLKYNATLSRITFTVNGASVSADVLGVPEAGVWYWIELSLVSGVASIRVAPERTDSFSPLDIEADSVSYTGTLVSGSFSLGSYGSVPSPAFHGSIAAVGVWSRALTACERGAINRPLDYPFPAAVPAIPYTANYVLAGEVACANPLLNYAEDQARFRCTDEADRLFAVGPDYKVYAAPRFPCGYILCLQWQGVRRKWLDSTLVPVDQQLREAVVNYVEHKLALKERNSVAMGEYLQAYTMNLRTLGYRYFDEQEAGPHRDCTAGIEQMMAAFQPMYASPLYGP